MHKKRLISGPYLAFILCGTIIPLLAVLYYALVDKNGAFTFSNLASIFGRPVSPAVVSISSHSSALRLT